MKYTYRCDNCDRTVVDELQYSLRRDNICCGYPMWYSSKQAQYLQRQMPDVFYFDRENYLSDLAISEHKRKAREMGDLEKKLREPLILPIIMKEEE